MLRWSLPSSPLDPLDEECIDEEVLHALGWYWLAEAGVDGLAAPGSTASDADLTRAEAPASRAPVVQAAAHVPALVGIGVLRTETPPGTHAAQR